MTEEQALKKWCPFARVMRTYSPDDAVEPHKQPAWGRLWQFR
jgi:hypothetical protein